jgi:hypothetical protein
MKFEELPYTVRDAAIRGLRDPEGSGSPQTSEEVVEQYESGLRIKQITEIAIPKAVEVSVFCGDCLRDIPYGQSCAHIKVGKHGKRNIIG